MKISLSPASLATSERKPSPVISREFAGFRYAAANQTAPARDHGHFAGELTRTVFCNQAFACEIRLHDLHSSGKKYVERNVLMARLEKYVARGDVPRPATGTNAIDLGNGKNRKGLRAGVERAG